jgi:hypothetical protein
MAIMMNCAQDWTYDMFLEDVKTYTALPIKGVHCRANASWRERFMRGLKTFARDFEEKWLEEHEGHMYDNGWIGNEFARALVDWGFSDYYKDAYGQRPHLNPWYYVHALGFHHSEDVGRTFCANPVRDAVRNAKYVREVMAQ